MSEGSSLWTLRLRRIPGGHKRGDWGQRELRAAGIDAAAG